VDLITVNKQGNQTHYQANSSNPVFNELKGLVDKTFGVVGVLTNAIEPLLPDIEFAFVYGSIAQGRESAESDIDLMMVADRMSYSDLMSRLLEAEQRLNRKINPTLYSTKEFNDRIVNQQNFIARVLEKNILWLHGKSSFDLKRYNGQAEAS
jgi:predicted nucleotidyltransferase